MLTIIIMCREYRSDKVDEPLSIELQVNCVSEEEEAEELFPESQENEDGSITYVYYI